MCSHTANNCSTGTFVEAVVIDFLIGHSEAGQTGQSPAGLAGVDCHERAAISMTAVEVSSLIHGCVFDWTCNDQKVCSYDFKEQVSHAGSLIAVLARETKKNH